MANGNVIVNVLWIINQKLVIDWRSIKVLSQNILEGERKSYVKLQYAYLIVDHCIWAFVCDL